MSTSKTISAAFDPKVKCSLVRAITFAPPLRSFLATIFNTPSVGTVAFGTPTPMACCGDSPPISAAPSVIVVKEATRTVPDDIQHPLGSISGLPSGPSCPTFVSGPSAPGFSKMEISTTSMAAPAVSLQLPCRDGWSISDGQDGSTACDACDNPSS